jgi:hypothetical protein
MGLETAQTIGISETPTASKMQARMLAGIAQKNEKL